MSEYNHLQKKIGEKAARRQAKKKPKMKVSGKSVIRLKKIITKKTDK